MIKPSAMVYERYDCASSESYFTGIKIALIITLANFLVIVILFWYVNVFI